jgi:hypothetical protein
MTAIRPNDLRSIHTFSDVLGFFESELDWPVETTNLDQATFDYTPDELGIPADQVPKLAKLRQLQPLSTEQPWGIFFLEFTGPRLPLTPLRRLLQGIVTRKRARTGQDHKTWNLHDLLFIITTNSGESVELHLVAFYEGEGNQPEIRSLPWRPTQSPDQHLRRLASELLPRLAWPDDPEDIDQWRLQWRDAFRLRHGEVLASTARLGERMADTAKYLRLQIANALEAEHGNGPLTVLLNEVRTELVGTVDAPKFADMCAQTLVYGLLSSRITDPDAFGASPVLSVVPLANPFLAAFFEQVHDQVAGLDLADSGLEQLIADLKASPVEAILDEFDSTAKGGDPVIHFYEEFLKRYDAKMRADAGAFYTPQPVVRFMVRTVDELLRDRLGLPLGIADATTWQQLAAQRGLTVPAGIDPQSGFVSMIDPATGTGTYLVEWLRRARQSYAQECPLGDWPSHLRDHVLPTMHALELMLAPYAVAHLKVALELQNQELATGDVTILLSDTLDHPSDIQQFPDLGDPVAAEGERASALKETNHFTVCIGNPPYDRVARKGLPRVEGTSELACPKGRPGRMLQCPSPIRRSSATMS